MLKHKGAFDYPKRQYVSVRGIFVIYPLFPDKQRQTPNSSLKYLLKYLGLFKAQLIRYLRYIFADSRAASAPLFSDG